MALNEERLKILQMVQEGKISPEEASLLLEALDGPKVEAQSRNQTTDSTPGKGGGKWFRVRVTDTNTGKDHVNVRIPIKLMRVGLKTGKNFAPEIEGLDTEELMQIIESGEIGKMVDVIDEKDGEHVEVFVE